jgi:hypothetical protein
MLVLVRHEQTGRMKDFHEAIELHTLRLQPGTALWCAHGAQQTGRYAPGSIVAGPLPLASTRRCGLGIARGARQRLALEHAAGWKGDSIETATEHACAIHTSNVKSRSPAVDQAQQAAKL